MGLLSIQAITKTFGSVRALDHTTFEVRPGEVFGFVGSNGAGKTTTMRVILGVLAPDSGEVTWDGAPLGLADRRQIGYMPEERGLYPKMRVGEQLIYLARLHGMSTADATAAMRQWTHRLGIESHREDEIQKLSLGNQQRVQLAAALIHEPTLLVLDEPFSGLDPGAVDVMSGVLRERSATGVPIMFSSHQLELVERLCDRVGIIKDGRMVTVGAIEDLRQTDRPQWLIEAAPPEEWLPDVPDARLLHTEGRRTVVELANDDSQRLVHAALAVGPVTEFSLVRPTLTELYRHVVTSDEATDDVPQEVAP